MTLFSPEELPLFSYETQQQIEQRFKQKPAILPLAPRPETIIITQRQDWLPIVALASILGLFAFLAFLAFMRRS